MANYSKPMVTVDQGLAEGVYADSGSKCYTATAYIHQHPETGRGDYRIQVKAEHDADHTNIGQIFTFTFNQEVTCKESSLGTVEGSATGRVIKIKRTIMSNFKESIGGGSLVVESEAGLAAPDVSVTDIFE